MNGLLWSTQKWVKDLVSSWVCALFSYVYVTANVRGKPFFFTHKKAEFNSKMNALLCATEEGLHVYTQLLAPMQLLEMWEST